MPFRFVYIILFMLSGLRTGMIWAQTEGLASYYSHRFHGKKSSSGRLHDNNELVAAHRTYPFGTFVRVTNLSNRKSVIVCITDRGPYKKGRIIDLSHAAAEQLEILKKGVAKVRVEVVPSPLDLRYLDLIYPKIPYLNVDPLRVTPPHKRKFKR